MDTTIELYRSEFQKHVEAGDDFMNAKLRIIESGCPVDVADRIEEEEEDELDEDDEDEDDDEDDEDE